MDAASAECDGGLSGCEQVDKRHTELNIYFATEPPWPPTPVLVLVSPRASSRASPASGPACTTLPHSPPSPGPGDSSHRPTSLASSSWWVPLPAPHPHSRFAGRPYASYTEHRRSPPPQTLALDAQILLPCPLACHIPSQSRLVPRSPCSPSPLSFLLIKLAHALDHRPCSDRTMRPPLA